MSQGSIIYIYSLGFLTNNGMPSANIFDILVRSALTAHVRRGSDNVKITCFRRGCMEKILRRSIPFFKPERPFYTYSIDLLILQEGLRYLFFGYDTSNMAKCAYREHLDLLRQRPPRHAPRSSALVAIQTAPRLYDMKCGA